MHSGKKSGNPAQKLILSMIPLSVAVMSLLFYTDAQAGDGELYAGFGIGASNLDPEIDDANINYGDGTFTGYKVFLGYDLSNNFSVEGMFADLGHVEIEDTSITNGNVTAGAGGGGNVNNQPGLQDQNFPFGGNTPDGSGGAVAGANATNGKGQLDYRVFGLQGIYQFPNNLPGFSAFGKLGIGQLSTSANGLSFEKDDVSGVIGGLGVEYQMLNGFSIRGEYDYYDKEAQLVSIDLLKRFGRPSALPKKAVVIDIDNDGVDDSRDRCPNTRRGVGVGVNGCALKAPTPPAVLTSKAPPLPKQDPLVFDVDADGVIDNLDLCLNTPAATPVDNRGCAIPTQVAAPAPEPVVVTEVYQQNVVDQFTGILEGVNFHVGSSRLTGEAKSILNTVAANLNQYAEIRATIIGHTDDSGNTAANKSLSEKRAMAVAQYLAEQGVDPSRMRYAGKGEEEPISSNTTEAGRSKNRRVELIAEEL